jgi:hypothetical protein
MNAPDLQHADAQHDATKQLKRLCARANSALDDAKALAEIADTPRHRQRRHDLTVLVDGLAKDLEVKR